eukprot:GEMP01077412.1.p1 GENE.GEMP01077412.1~~GEMP01077412.1.p1  ORF type:complete len:130 (+),score=18.47 GEMP01077412.1:102-491(+)
MIRVDAGNFPGHDCPETQKMEESAIPIYSAPYSLEEDKSYLTRSPPSSCETKWKPTPPDLPESDYTPRATVDLKNIIWHQEALLHTLRFLRSKLGEEDVRIKDALGGLHNQLTPADNGTQRLFPRKRVL